VATPREFNLCYLDTGPDEGKWEPAEQKIALALEHRSATSASHLLGQALGLTQLGTGDIAAAPAGAYDGNIMRGDPDDRGKKLTLGQVYRINAELGVLDPCPPNSDDCPVLYADVRR
jgi:hypothetical protein